MRAKNSVSETSWGMYCTVYRFSGGIRKGIYISGIAAFVTAVKYYSKRVQGKL
jgi:hypothetical protein